MKIIFFGTSDFAVSILEALLSTRHRISAVVTAADKRKGRGQRIGLSPVKILAQKRGLALFQPANLRDAKFVQCLKNEPADLFVVCAYGRILTKEVLRIPKDCAINLHASLLPKYRGAAPVNWAIIRGEKETGVTVFKMDEYMDKGEIILQRKTDISLSDSAVSLAGRLSKIGAQVLLKAIDLIEQKKATFITQDEAGASSAPKLKKEDGLINWGLAASEIHNRVRGLQPWPGAFTYLENRLLKIRQSQIVGNEQGRNPGEIIDVSEKGILVQTGRGGLLITVLQLEGKKEMPSGEFILGHKLEVGKRLLRSARNDDGMEGDRNG